MKKNRTAAMIVFVFVPIFLFVWYMFCSYTMFKNSKIEKEKEKTQLPNSNCKKNISIENKKKHTRRDRRSNEEKFSSYIC